MNKQPRRILNLVGTQQPFSSESSLDKDQQGNEKMNSQTLFFKKSENSKLQIITAKGKAEQEVRSVSIKKGYRIISERARKSTKSQSGGGL